SYAVHTGSVQTGKSGFRSIGEERVAFLKGATIDDFDLAGVKSQKDVRDAVALRIENLNFRYLREVYTACPFFLVSIGGRVKLKHGEKSPCSKISAIKIARGNDFRSAIVVEILNHESRQAKIFRPVAAK